GVPGAAGRSVRRNIVVGFRREVARGRAAVGRHDEKVAALALGPVIPVAVEQVVVNARFYFALFFFFIAFGVARVIFAIHIDSRREDDALPIRRPFEQI